jgi:tellurite resistance protein
MEAFIFIVFILIIRAFIGAMSSETKTPTRENPMPPPRSSPERLPAPRTAEGSGPRGRRDVHDGILRVTRAPDVWIPDGATDGEGLPVTRISITGEIYVPHNNYPVHVIVRLFDVTDGDSVDDRMPILSSMDDLRDENGFFEYVDSLHVPYESSTMSDYVVCGIPDFDLVPAKRGRRRMIAYVLFTEAYDHDDLITYGSVEFDMTFNRVGYLEWEQHALEQEEHLVSIFVASSAVDGSIDKVELDAIKKYFASRYEGREDAKKWKSRASEALKAAVSDIQEKRVTPGALLTKAAKAIVAAEEPEVTRAAFEVALRAVAADGVVHPKEEKLLTRLSTVLGLDDNVVRDLRDRILRASMFQGAEDEVILGMPSGLDDASKRVWLSGEYGKWRGRVAHSNPDIAAEATMRLERIAKLRTTLG